MLVLLMNQSMSYSLIISATTSNICLYSVVDFGANNYDYFVERDIVYTRFLLLHFLLLL